MTPSKLRSEIRRRANKESYKGAALERRIRKQMKVLDTSKELERWAKREWFQYQLQVMAAEDELNLLCTIKLNASQSAQEPNK